MPAWMLSWFRLSKREYYADFLITPPVTAVYAIYAWEKSSNATAFIGMFILGWLLWTFYEYILHRYILHAFFFFRNQHDMHHDDAKDYIGLPPWGTVFNYLAFYFMFGIHSNALMVGFSTGYIMYAVLHTIVHYKRIRKTDRLWNLYRRHCLHHTIGNVNYGVTLSVWDRLFRTEYIAGRKRTA